MLIKVKHYNDQHVRMDPTRTRFFPPRKSRKIKKWLNEAAIAWNKFIVKVYTDPDFKPVQPKYPKWLNEAINKED